MTRLDAPPPWSLKTCPNCGWFVSLATHDLSCPCFDTRTRVAVGWICDDCDLVIGLVGLFTTWAAAISARQLELDVRAARYFSCGSAEETVSITTDHRRNVTTQSRRVGTE